MSIHYTPAKVAAIRDLASEAEGYFDHELWGAGYEDDVEAFGEGMRDFLESNGKGFGDWSENEELQEFKKRQEEADVSGRELLIGLWGARAFASNTYNKHDWELIRLLREGATSRG